MKKSTKHILVITDNRWEKDGEIDWFVEHDKDCPQEEWLDTDFEGKHEPTMLYTCSVQYEIDNLGQDAFGDYITTLKPGRYEFYAWNTYDSYSHEYDGGIEFI